MASQADDNRNDDIDEATLLKDWDFARFFPSKFQCPDSSSSTSSSSAKNKPQEKEKKLPTHRRMDSDSKITNPFFRGFRRENSDFFPLSSRHSAIFVDRSNRSSNIFNNRRGSDVGVPKKSGEPVLTDFVKRSSDSPNNELNAKYGALNIKSDSSFLRPRREKTESDIILRHSDARKGIRESLEARRREVEGQFAREAENIRRRSARPIEVNSMALSSATNSVSGEEYLFIQVIFGFGLLGFVFEFLYRSLLACSYFTNNSIRHI